MWYGTYIEEKGDWFYLDTPGAWRDFGIEEVTDRRRWLNDATGVFFAV